MSTAAEQERYERWRKAAVKLAQEHDGPDFEDLVTEEQAAWDDMADNDDPYYVDILMLVKGWT
jgi:hypothetical protein